MPCWRKNVYLAKNDGKRMVVKCIIDCNFYIRIGMSAGNQYLLVVSLYDEHTCHRATQNIQVKTECLDKQFSHILRHNLNLKPTGLVAMSFERRGVKMSTS